MYKEIIKKLDDCKNIHRLIYGTWNRPEEIYISLEDLKYFLEKIMEKEKEKERK